MEYPKVWMSLTELKQNGLPKEFMQTLIKGNYGVVTTSMNGGKLLVRSATIDQAIERFNHDLKARH